jgi:phospholipid/cholesterol/gamma-HCH transport system permease protein
MAEAQEQEAEVRIDDTGGGVTVALSGRLDARGVARVWDEAMVKTAGRKAVRVDASAVTYCDGAGLALLFDLKQSRNAEVAGLKPDYEKLLDPFARDKLPDLGGKRRRRESLAVTVGRATALILRDLRDQITFTGQLAVVLLSVVIRPHKVRWGDAWETVEKAGANALPIVGMIGFLMGLIMAFQSTVPLRQFGVDIFVVNLVALAMLRELGAVMTAIMLAGRSGSAFAAEIGTMKVNEEVDALKTMGLEPVRFLVVPKVLAAIFVTPLLTIYANLLGIFGGLLVVLSFGHPWAAVLNQLTSAVEINDILTGLVKSVFFGLLVGAIGCLRGLQTKLGATAVGDSTTRAVVSGIFLIVLVDAIFAVIFYAIDF